MDESLKFYNELLGLEISEKFNIGEDIEIVMLVYPDKPKIELISSENDKINILNNRISIGSKVDLLDNAIEYVKDNYVSIKKGPIFPNPTTSFLFINNPNGIEIQLVENKRGVLSRSSVIRVTIIHSHYVERCLINSVEK